MSDVGAREARAGYLAAAVPVLLAGAAFHFVKLATLPHGLFHDEAYNLLDEATITWGHTPVFFTANEGREALYFYWQHLFVFALGTSTFATRLPSAFISVAEIALEIAVMRRLFGARVGLLSGAVLATLYEFVQDGRLGLRFTSLPVVVLLTILALWTAIRGGRLRAFAWAGAAIGLGAYTYVAARMLPVVAALYGVHAVATQPRRWRTWLAGIGLAAVVSAAIASPLAVTVLSQPAGTARLGETSIVRADRGPVQNARAVAANVVTYAKSYSVLGDVQWLSNIRGRPVFDPVMGAWFYAGMAILALGVAGRAAAPGATRDGRTSSDVTDGTSLMMPGAQAPAPVAGATATRAVSTHGPTVIGRSPGFGDGLPGESDRERAPHPVGRDGPAPLPVSRGPGVGAASRRDACLLCLIAFAALYAPGVLTTEAPYFQRVYGTIPIVAVAPALAMDWLVRRAPERAWRWGAILAVVLSLAVQTFSTARDYFTVFARAKESAFDLGSGSTAIAEYVSAQQPNGDLYISTYDDVVLKALAPAQVATARWFHARELLPLPADPARPAYYFFDFTDPSPVEAMLRSVATPVMTAVDGNVGIDVARGYRVEAGRSLASLLPSAPRGTFGGALTITGARISQNGASPGAIDVLLGLRAERDSPGYLSVSVRAVDGAGTVWVARDGVGADLSRWRAGQAALSLHPLRLPAGTPPGTLTIVASVYQVATLRLLELDGGGSQLTLGTATVDRPVPLAKGAALPPHQALDLPLGREVQVLGIEPYSGAPRQGDTWRLGTLWRCVQPGPPGSTLEIDLVDVQGSLLGRLEPAGGLAAPAPGGCTPGDVVVDRRLGRIGARWPSGAAEARATLLDPAGRQLERQTLARFTIQPLTRQMVLPSVAVPLDVRFADGVVLVGAGVERASGARTSVRLVWRSTGEPRLDRTVFVHLVGPRGDLLAQHDSSPANGLWPLTAWTAGQVVDDLHPLPLGSASAPAGSYLEVGMYEPATGERLPIVQPGLVGVRDNAARIPWSSLSP